MNSSILTYNKSGIYSIVNCVNNKMYIGSSINLEKRKGEHLKKLRAGNHINPKLQSAFNLHGEQNFSFDVIEIVSNKQDLIKREQNWVDFFNSEYNICKKMVGSRLGTTQGEGFKRKMKGRTPWNKGRKITEQERINLSEAHKGFKVSQETKAKMSEAGKGKKFGKDTIKKRIEFMQNVKINREVINVNNGIFYTSMKNAFLSYGGGEKLGFKKFKRKISSKDFPYKHLEEAKKYKKRVSQLN